MTSLQPAKGGQVIENPVHREQVSPDQIIAECSLRDPKVIQIRWPQTNVVFTFYQTIGSFHILAGS